MEQVIAGLAIVPKEIWGVIVGALLTLFGTLLSNRQNAKQNKEQRTHDAARSQAQLDHDAGENKKQRLADLRTDVYLVAAEEMVKANSLLGQLPTTDITKVNVGASLVPFFASMVKLQMVGDLRTAGLATNLAATYGDLLGRLITAVLPIRDAASELETKNIYFEESQVEIKRLQAAMQAQNESGVVDLGKFDILNEAYKFNQERAAAIERERAVLRETGLRFQMEFTKSIPSMLRAVYADFLPLLVEIRRELEVHGELAQFQRILEMQAQRAQAMVDRVEVDLKDRLPGEEAKTRWQSMHHPL